MENRQEYRSSPMFATAAANHKWENSKFLIRSCPCYYSAISRFTFFNEQIEE